MRCQGNNEGLKSTNYIRRLSNPNFEEDFNERRSRTMDTDEVLASLSSVTLTSSADDDNSRDVDRGQPVNHDDCHAATAMNSEEREVRDAVWCNVFSHTTTKWRRTEF